jgi:hypothetical protein
VDLSAIKPSAQNSPVTRLRRLKTIDYANGEIKRIEKLGKGVRLEISLNFLLNYFFF